MNRDPALGEVIELNSFGVGSFLFSVQSTRTEKLESHISGLNENLRNIPGINNIHIKPEPLTFKMLPDGEIKLSSFLTIEFEIDLSAGPHSLQDENNFIFYSRPFYDSVVTLIFPKFNSNDPSSSIYRVREYIKSYLKKPYSLEVVGPSPFHADFFVHKTNFFRVDIVKTRGYDKNNVHVKSSKPNEIVEEIFRELGDELNLFYLIRQCEKTHIEYWRNVSEAVAKALRPVGFFSIGLVDQFTWLRSSRLGHAMQKLAEFEAQSLSLPQIIEQRFGDTYDAGGAYLISYNKKENKEFASFPTDSTQNLLKFVAEMRGRNASTITSYVTIFLNVVLTTAVAVTLYLLGIKS